METADPKQFHVTFIDGGRSATQPPNPEYPNGIDLAPYEGYVDTPLCKVELPYPARCVGGWRVECVKCGAGIICTTAGRADDPRSITVPCRIESRL
jgi:hypothetical protein